MLSNPTFEILERVGDAERRELCDHLSDPRGRRPGKGEARVVLDVLRPALRDDERNVVVLFAGAEPAKVVDDRREQSLRRQAAVTPQ